jgi:hypothetical protein
VTSNDYAGWSARKELAAGIAAGSLADPASDFDGDGLSQLVEYALEGLGFDPVQPDSSLLPAAQIDGQTLHMRFVVNTSRSDVAVGAEASTDLRNWYQAGDPGAPGGFADVGEIPVDGELEAREAVVPLARHAAVYLRLRVNTLP